MSSLWIINKAGGLIYQADYFVPAAAAAGAPPLSANEALILAGTLHGIHAITARINPTRARGEGLECLRGDGFELHVRSTLTGIKLLLLAAPTLPNAPALLQQAYEAYADLVMKNPFYSPEMPVRIPRFDERVRQIVGGS
ncbi:Sybindin-like protein [Tilletiopsis washingtonensis]|uniref:Trafficking protein particle complex subunit n=1 Tax=Tilletiopsis washingtonensis TaxID=58919 RepID=A0A316Z904_9BASI|nr:Sybindin-like protein [Tilletiopsis washingtonensis]PWN98061.1 Sybindin-like protein [Tilletiopsis washingtonensis]